MALIHECAGIVITDPTGTYKVGQKVVMIPNQPPRQRDEEFYENYMTGTHFLSSGFDGFMREFVSLPKDRVVAYDDIEDTVAAITEFVSVGMHAMSRLLTLAHSKRDRIAVIGDGSLAFVVANIINYTLPEAALLVVIGKNWNFSHLPKNAILLIIFLEIWPLTMLLSVVVVMVLDQLLMT